MPPAAPSAEVRESVAAVDAVAPGILDVARDIWAHPELGFREVRTAAVVADWLRALGLSPREGLALTGVRADLDLDRPGPTVAILGELDALPVPDHPAADRATGAAHACGHHAQIAQMLGVAAALVRSDLPARLAGRVAFIAVPAEEFVDLGWRQEQARAGRIEFLGGKPELIRLGVFDDVDMAMLIHASSSPEDRRLSIPAGSTGFVVKRTRFLGRAAHAAAAPDEGVNALHAASLALTAIGMQRETFRDEDRVRVHSILSRGGDAVNVVPAETTLETQVRAVALEAMQAAAGVTDRCLRAAALAIGTGVEIDTLAGYLPLVENPELARRFAAWAQAIVGEEGWAERPPIAASTDAGDLSQVMPLIHPSAGGFGGTIHGAAFHVVDENAAYLDPTRALVATVVDLLADGAAGARSVLGSSRPRLSIPEYLALVRGMSGTVRYEPDGTLAAGPSPA
ncbi:MAG: amidohydrolase [Chloroflexi bacterium]|nr:amidohydrolase [Chloroflexota bacterium]